MCIDVIISKVALSKKTILNRKLSFSKKLYIYIYIYIYIYRERERERERENYIEFFNSLTSVKLAPHLLKNEIFIRVLNAP